MSRGYENALLLVTKTIDKVMTGELELKDLIVSKILRQDLYKYRSLFPHVSAALRLTEAGVPLTRGDTIQYIYTDAAHSNPLRRVTPVEFIEEGREQVYDKEKYREMLLEAAETVLGYFGFDRTLFGGTSRSKNRKWWHQTQGASSKGYRYRKVFKYLILSLCSPDISNASDRKNLPLSKGTILFSLVMSIFNARARLLRLKLSILH